MITGLLSRYLVVTKCVSFVGNSVITWWNTIVISQSILIQWTISLQGNRSVVSVTNSGY